MAFEEGHNAGRNPRPVTSRVRRAVAGLPEGYHANPINREKVNEDARKRYADNPERQRGASRKYIEANPEKVREMCRRSAAKYCDANAEKCREYARKYNEANPDKRRAVDRKSRYNIPAWLSPYIDEHIVTGNCPGCGVKFGHPQSVTRACIDHDHATGLVRMIVCHLCNTQRLRNCDDGCNPDALLLAAGRTAQMRGRKAKVRALIQIKLAALLIAHYRGAEVAPAVGRMLAIPIPD